MIDEMSVDRRCDDFTRSQLIDYLELSRALTVVMLMWSEITMVSGMDDTNGGGEEEFQVYRNKRSMNKAKMVVKRLASLPDRWG